MRADHGSCPPFLNVKLSPLQALLQPGRYPLAGWSLALGLPSKQPRDDGAKELARRAAAVVEGRWHR
jgi:hypothetical protein